MGINKKMIFWKTIIAILGFFILFSGFVDMIFQMKNVQQTITSFLPS